MSQSDSSPVFDPTQIDFPPEICAYLTTLLHQTLASTVELQSHVAQVSWDVQGQDVFRWRTIFAAMNAALDAYTDLVAERLAVPGRVAVGHGRHDDLVGEVASVSRRHSGG
jgi:starvation-inducible DNA-binding protein